MASIAAVSSPVAAELVAPAPVDPASVAATVTVTAPETGSNHIPPMESYPSYTADSQFCHEGINSAQFMALSEVALKKEFDVEGVLEYIEKSMCFTPPGFKEVTDDEIFGIDEYLATVLRPLLQLLAEREQKMTKVIDHKNYHYEVKRILSTSAWYKTHKMRFDDLFLGSSRRAFQDMNVPFDDIIKSKYDEKRMVIEAIYLFAVARKSKFHVPTRAEFDSQFPYLAPVVSDMEIIRLRHFLAWIRVAYLVYTFNQNQDYFLGLIPCLSEGRRAKDTGTARRKRRVSYDTGGSVSLASLSRIVIIRAENPNRTNRALSATHVASLIRYTNSVLRMEDLPKWIFPSDFDAEAALVSKKRNRRKVRNLRDSDTDSEGDDNSIEASQQSHRIAQYRSDPHALRYQMGYGKDEVPGKAHRISASPYRGLDEPPPEAAEAYPHPLYPGMYLHGYPAMSPATMAHYPYLLGGAGPGLTGYPDMLYPGLPRMPPTRYLPPSHSQASPLASAAELQALEASRMLRSPYYGAPYGHGSYPPAPGDYGRGDYGRGDYGREGYLVHPHSRYQLPRHPHPPSSLAPPTGQRGPPIRGYDGLPTPDAQHLYDQSVYSRGREEGSGGGEQPNLRSHYDYLTRMIDGGAEYPHTGGPALEQHLADLGQIEPSTAALRKYPGGMGLNVRDLQGGRKAITNLILEADVSPIRGKQPPSLDVSSRTSPRTSEEFAGEVTSHANAALSMQKGNEAVPTGSAFFEDVLNGKSCRDGKGFVMPARRSGVIGDEMMWNMEAYHVRMSMDEGRKRARNDNFE